FYALDAATGVRLWEFKTGSWVESSPAVVNGTVYFGSNDGRLYALDALTGKKRWEFKIKYSIKSSPAIANGIVYFGSNDYKIYAVDAVKGTKRWDFETNSYVTSSPVVANGLVFIGSLDGFFYVLNARNGKRHLKFKAYNSVVSSPSVIDDIVYFNNTSGSLYAIDSKARNWPMEHKLTPYWKTLYLYQALPRPPPPSGYLWSLRLGSSAISSPAVKDGLLYLGSGNKLSAIDTQTHEVRWAFNARGRIYSSSALGHLSHERQDHFIPCHSKRDGFRGLPRRKPVCGSIKDSRPSKIPAKNVYQ
ncbi:MAG: PQQ-like beta-propeller repeat protein, partial [Deltaproteobacteria bacterium]|nr:PQQ-like beta-propeller repeat protein [Deltaproteobacteria bacterium]